MDEAGDFADEKSPPSKAQSPTKADKPQKAFSCLRCFERKVKCDKSHPCANCTKSNVDCVFRIPSAPRRKKKRATEDVLLERLKRAEDLLRSKGITNESQSSGSSLTRASTTENPESVEALARQASSESGDVDAATKRNDAKQAENMGMGRENFLTKGPYASGRLIVSQDQSRFVDNNLWTSVTDEFSQPRDAIANNSSDESDEESLGDDSGDMVLGLTPTSHGGVAHLHPATENLFKLWHIFLENVNPMTKIIHRPSLEKQVVKASQDLDAIPRGLECLMFAIYTCAIGSMNEEDCEKILGESRDVLFKRYRTGCRRALARAKFLGTGDLMVCQSFVLYVLIMRETLDARTVWTLSGVANRIAQGLGLHRDGSELGLPVFESEMRRRLWWQLIILDFRSAELTGSGRFGDFWSDTHTPNNLDDVDFWPGITEQEFADRISAKGSNRATEMISCLLRCEFGSFWKEKMLQKSKSSASPMNAQLFTGKPPSPWDVSLKERDEVITELERRLEDKFLRYCDVNNPLQFMASIIGRGAVASMRLMAHHPRRWANEADMPADERALLWKLSIKLLESDSLVHSTKALQRFMWHSNVYFQWQALVYLLGELKNKTVGDDVNNAWRKIEETYHHHPAFIVEFRKPLHAAVGSLCLKAWDARNRGRAEAQERGEFLIPVQTPDFIAMLREQRRAGPAKRKSTGGGGSGLVKQMSMSTDPNGYNNFNTQQQQQQPGMFGSSTYSLPILTPSASSATPTTNDSGSSGAPTWPDNAIKNYTGGNGNRPTNATFSGVMARMPLDFSGDWDGNNNSNSNSNSNNAGTNEQGANMSPFTSGATPNNANTTATTNANQYGFSSSYDPIQIGMLESSNNISGPNSGSTPYHDLNMNSNNSNASFGGNNNMFAMNMGNNGGDVLMGDMDWNQWDYLIQDYDVMHGAPGGNVGFAAPGAGGGGL